MFGFMSMSKRFYVLYLDYDFVDFGKKNKIFKV